MAAVFEGIRQNIRETLAKLRDLNLGKTIQRYKAARVHRNNKKRARRELFDVRDVAVAQYERLIAAGRDPHDDHLRTLYVRAQKADAHADELGEFQADLTRLVRHLKGLTHRKTEARHDLEAKLRAQRKNLREARRRYEQQHNEQTSGVTTVDGKPVASWIARYVLAVRAAGRWHGIVNSGYRDPAYSESLCIGICGQPTCPGTCAGRGSSHSQLNAPAGAVDVSDPGTFGAECARLGIPLRNTLAPADPWHYSTAGN